MVSYTLSRSFSLPRVVVLCNEFPLYISSIKYFNGDFSKEEESDIKMYNQQWMMKYERKLTFVLKEENKAKYMGYIKDMFSQTIHFGW